MRPLSRKIIILQLAFILSLYGANLNGQNDTISKKYIKLDSIITHNMQRFLDEFPDSIANDSISGIYSLNNYLNQYPDSIKNDTSSAVFKQLKFCLKIIHSNSPFSDWKKNYEWTDTITRNFCCTVIEKKIKIQAILCLCPKKIFSLDILFKVDSNVSKFMNMLNGYYYEKNDTLFLKNLNDSTPYILIKYGQINYKPININSIFDHKDFTWAGDNNCRNCMDWFFLDSMKFHDLIYLYDTNHNNLSVAGRYINEYDETSILLLKNRTYKISFGSIIFSKGKWLIKGDKLILKDKYLGRDFVFYFSQGNLFNFNAPVTRSIKFIKVNF